MEVVAENIRQRTLAWVSVLCLSLAGCSDDVQQTVSSSGKSSDLSARSATEIQPENALELIRELSPARSPRPTFSEEGEFEAARRFFRALALDFEQAGIPAPESSEDFFTSKKDVHDFAISHGLFFLMETIPISEELSEYNVGLFRIAPSVQSSDLLREISFAGLDGHHYSEREQFEIFDVQEVLHPSRTPFLGYTERIPGHGMVVLFFPVAIASMAEKLDVPVDIMQQYVAANEFGHVYLNDYLLSKEFPHQLLGGYTGSIFKVSFPFSERALSILEFHEAFSELSSAKYGGLEMPSLLDVYNQIRLGDLPKVYRFSIAMQNFALIPAVQLHSAGLSESSLPKEGKPFPIAALAFDLRTSPEVAPLFFEDYISSFEGRMIPMTEYIANVGRFYTEKGD